MTITSQKFGYCCRILRLSWNNKNLRVWFQLKNDFFTIVAEIHAHSLVNFYCQYGDRHLNLSEQEREIRQFVIVKKKLMSVFNINAPVLTVIDNEFRHNIVKVVCGSTWLSPRGSTATLPMWWQNLWSITGQMHKNWHQFVKFHNETKMYHHVMLFCKRFFSLEWC